VKKSELLDMAALAAKRVGCGPTQPGQPSMNNAVNTVRTNNHASGQCNELSHF